MRRIKLPAWLHLESRTSRIIAAAAVLLLAGIYGLYRWELRAPGAGSSQGFVVASGERVPTIAAHLQTAGLIRNRTAFITFLNFHGLRAKIKAGSYSLSPTLNGPQVADILTDGDVS